MTQSYTVDVEVVEGASRGCTAILRCLVPSHVKDLVKVVSWLQEPAFHIYPSLQGGNLIEFHLSQIELFEFRLISDCFNNLDFTIFRL